MTVLSKSDVDYAFNGEGQGLGYLGLTYRSSNIAINRKHVAVGG